MTNNIPVDSTSYDDLDIKEHTGDTEEIPHIDKKKRNRWLTIGLASLLVTAILFTAIAIPVSITQRNKSVSSSAENVNYINNIHNSTGNLNSTETNVSNANTNITAASIPQPVNNNKNSRNRLLITADEGTNFHPPQYAHEISPYSNLIRLKTFTPPAEGRIFVMGDIHGSIDEMNALLEKIDFQRDEDVLILTGDLVFRGKDSVGVIRRARELNALCVRGNHDDKVVRFRGYLKKYGVNAMSDSRDIMPEGKVGDPLKFSNKHREIATDMSEEDYEYLAGCPLILDIPDLQARVVHGGLDPTVENLINNDPWSVMNMRDMDDDNEPSKSKQSKKSPSSSHIHWTEAYQTYADAHNLDVTVYYGHDASRGISLNKKTIGVDSGCVYGRKLSAIDMRTKELFQVDCVGTEEVED